MAKLKFVLVFAATMTTMLVGAHPGPSGPGPRPLPMHGPRIHHAPPPAPPHPKHHHHHHSAGSFWTGVGVGLLGSLIAPPPPPPLPQTVVVATPPNPAPVVIQTARVWVPPVYGEWPIYRAGIHVGTERYTITPGYWR